MHTYERNQSCLTWKLWIDVCKIKKINTEHPWLKMTFWMSFNEYFF